MTVLREHTVENIAWGRVRFRFIDRTEKNLKSIGAENSSVPMIAVSISLLRVVVYFC